MKNILISCISKFDRNKLDQGAYTYQNHDLTVTAFQTNEACLKYLLSRLGADDQLDVHIRVQSNDVAAPGDFTMEYLNGEIGRFCGENGFSVPQYFDVFLGEMNKLSEKCGVNIVMTSSIPVEEASETVKKYL